MNELRRRGVGSRPRAGPRRLWRHALGHLHLMLGAKEEALSWLQRALELGAYSVVTMPVDLASLRRVMAGLFRRCFDWELE